MQARRFVRVIVQNHKGQTLVVSHRAAGREGWNFPGGKVEINEAPETAAFRELFEEVGIKVKRLSLAHEGWHLFEDGWWYGYMYATELVSTAPKNLEPSKLAAVAFLDYSDIVQGVERPFVLELINFINQKRKGGTPMAGFIVRNDPSLVIVPDWKEFCAWTRDAGYDESYLDINDSKCMALQEQYLAEVAEEGAA